jgi:hypothetical protein
MSRVPAREFVVNAYFIIERTTNFQPVIFLLVPKARMTVLSVILSKNKEADE